MNRYVFDNLMRNLRSGWRMYVLGIVIASIAFGLSGAFFLVHRNLALTTQLWASSVPVTVMLDPALPQVQVQALIRRAQAEGAVRVDLVTPEQGRRRLEAALGTRDLLSGFRENPIPPMLELAYAEPPPPERLAAMLRWPGVTEVDDASQWSSRFHRLRRAVDRVGAGLLLLLLLAAVGSVGLTVRLVAASHAAESEIQRLVGASEAFVRAPYLLSGGWIGLAGIGVSLAGLAGGFRLIPRPRPGEWPVPVHELVFFSGVEAGVLLAAGFCVGVAGAWLGLSRRGPA